MNTKRNLAFTLIELLVVISIIVLLLSLLAPALSTAIERAEIVKCAANVHAITQSVNLYAAAYKRFYPDRGTSTGHVSDLTLNYGRSGDIRPLIREFLPLKHFNDPMVQEVDFEPELTAVSARVVASYNILWNVNWGSGSMNKIGQKLTWAPATSPDTTNPHIGKKFKFEILIADMDHVYNDTTFWMGHPGENGNLTNNARQNDRGGDGLYTSSYWSGSGDTGKQSFNYGYQDGSTQTIDGAQWIDGDGDPSTVDWVAPTFSDSKVEFITTPRDTKNNNNYPGRRSKLPRP